MNERDERNMKIVLFCIMVVVAVMMFFVVSLIT